MLKRHILTPDNLYSVDFTPRGPFGKRPRPTHIATKQLLGIISNSYPSEVCKGNLHGFSRIQCSAVQYAPLHSTILVSLRNSEPCSLY